MESKVEALLSEEELEHVELRAREVPNGLQAHYPTDLIIRLVAQARRALEYEAVMKAPFDAAFRLEALQSENADLKAQLERLKQEVETYELDTECPHCEEIVTVKGLGCRNVRAKLTKAETEITRLTEENQKLTETGIELLRQLAELKSRLAAATSALERIASEKSCVESQSTGMKQWFKTMGAKIAEEALAAVKGVGNG